MPIGADRVALMSAGGAKENYFGDGSDGAFSSSGDTAITPTNLNGDWDADMVVKNYTSFTCLSWCPYLCYRECCYFRAFWDHHIGYRHVMHWWGS